MAKVALSKLNLPKKIGEVKKINIGTEEVEVKQYLPVDEKLTIIGNTIAQAAEENNFLNPVKLDVFMSLEIIFAYTNISFTEKQKSNIPALFDLLESNDVINEIVNALPEKEYDAIRYGVMDCAKAYYEYKTSAAGILEVISQDYSNLDLNAEEIQKKINNPEEVGFLKEVLTKLG